MAKSYITVGLFVLLAVALLFFWRSSTDPDTIYAAGFNLFLIAAVGVPLLLRDDAGLNRVFFEVKNANDFFNDAALGVVLGVASLIGATMLLVFIASSANAVVSHISVSSVLDNSVSSVVAYSQNSKLITTLLQPVTETILLIGVGLLVYSFKPKDLKDRSTGALGWLAFSFIIAMTVFAVFHFAAKGVGAYPNDFQGWISFATDTTNLGLPNYSGALPQLVLGGFWIFFALGFRSWVVAAFAHITANVIAVGQQIGFGDAIVFFIVVVLIGLVIAIYQKNRFSEAKTWSWRAVLQYE